MTDVSEPPHRAPGPDTAEGALWRRMLAAVDNVASDFAHVDGRWLMRPAVREAESQSSRLRTALSDEHFNAITRTAFDSLSDEDPEARENASDWLGEIMEAIDDADFAELVLDNTATYAFACAYSPSEQVQAAAGRYFEAVIAMRTEIARRPPKEHE